jgi:hypothetical protein
VEPREQFEKLSLLWAQGSELSLAIVGTPRVRNHLSDRMWATALRHTKMAGELAALQAVVSSTMELVLGSSRNERFWLEIMDELVVEFRRLEELCSRLERLGARICDLLLGLSLGQA